MDSSPIMLRTASQSSDRTRSGESVESPATAPTLYTPEAQRYNGGLVRTFGSLASDASSPATGSASDMSKAKNAPLGRPTRYVVVFADKPEHVKVLATITVCSPNPFQTEVTAC